MRVRKADGENYRVKWGSCGVVAGVLDFDNVVSKF